MNSPVTPSEGAHYKTSKQPMKKCPPSIELKAFSAPKLSAGEVGRCRRLCFEGAPAKAQEFAAKRRLSGLRFGRLIGLVLRLEDDPFVEFCKGELNLDFRQGENGVGDQDFVRPCIARAGEDESV